jgi:hypothetical protein
LDALEVHSGIVVTGFREINRIPGPYRELAAAMRPTIIDLLGEGMAGEHRQLRVTMAISAVEGVVMDLMRSSSDPQTFVEELRDRRDTIIGLVLRILR